MSEYEEVRLREEQMANELQEKEDFEQMQFAKYGGVAIKLTQAAEYKPKKFTQSQVRAMFVNPVQSKKDLQGVSNYLNVSSGGYSRLLRHFDTMLTYDLMLVPYSMPEPDKVDADRMYKAWYKAAEFLERFNYKAEFEKITKSLIKDGEWFGYIVEDKEAITLWKLPSEYCRIVAYEQGVARIEFNTQFFAGTNERFLKAFPSEFAKMKKEADKGAKKSDPDDRELKWREVSDRGVGIIFDPTSPNGIPMLSGVFEDILELEDYKDLAKAKTELDNYALIHQKAPFRKDAKNYKDMLLPLDKLTVFHNNAKKNTPKQVGIVTNPLDLELFRFDKNSSDIDNVSKAERRVLSSAGVSPHIISSDKSTGEALKKSINADENILFSLLRVYEIFLKRELARLGTNKYNWMARMLDITHYNSADKIKDGQADIAVGGFKTEYYATRGYSPMGAINMLTWENEVLGITDKMRATQTSFTQSGSEEKTAGSPKTDTPTASTEKSRDNT